MFLNVKFVDPSRERRRMIKTLILCNSDSDRELNCSILTLTDISLVNVVCNDVNDMDCVDTYK